MKLTDRQEQAKAVLSGGATHCMLFGGSRSGKTFLLVRQVVLRALKSPGSRHAIFRFRYNHLKASVVLDTFPKVMRLCFPGVEWTPHAQDGYAELQGGSQVWFAGLDDKDRTEKILGMEFATVYFNECSQIPAGSVDTALTRLAQKPQGGPWPAHCIAESRGAEFPSSLHLPPSTIVISKGMDQGRESYSGFQGTCLDVKLQTAGITRLFVGGLATDYCVLHTVKDARRLEYVVYLLIDAVRAVNVLPHDGSRAEKAMLSAGAIPLRCEQLLA